VYVSPRPTPSALPRYYPAESYEPHQGDFDAHDDRPIDTLRRWLFAPRPGRWRRRLGGVYNRLSHRALVAALDAEPGRVLDVGCGTGGYLRTWQRLGWIVEGIEPAANAARIAASRLQARVHVGTIDEVALADESYDLVTMCHSLEHVPSPRAALQRVFDALRPGGRLVVMVPNFASWERRVFGKEWFGLEVPRHLFHFEPATLRSALESAGLRVLEIGGTANPGTLVRHLRRRLGKPPVAAAPLAVRALLTGALVPAAYLMQSKALWAVARKPS
jgi:2-polyprenyl-3-methyl-5-hydroxy-6-metoxy-1,4-benzoquinol methylase